MELIIGVLFAGFIAICLFVGVVLIGGAERRRSRLSQTWGAYAARQGYSFVEGASHERPFRIEGSRDGVDFAIETTRRSGSRVPVTCLSARASVPTGIRLSAALGEGRRGEADGPIAPTGDPHFDHVFEVRASDPAGSGSVLRPGLREALQRFPLPMFRQGLRLTIDGAELALEWAGDEPSPSELLSAHAIIREAQRAVPVRERPA
jgi:hypothetical protein